MNWDFGCFLVGYRFGTSVVFVCEVGVLEFGLFCLK